MPKTILIVDDFASVRLYHTTFLTRKGFHCIDANNGADALLRIREASVDLILLDMLMPGMSGADFVETLDQDASFSEIPILIVTSEEAQTQRIFERNQRPYAILTKPVMPEALLKSVNQLLRASLLVPPPNHVS